MASAVNFRMHHGAENSQQIVNFVGNGIRVLDLKREILERKKFSPTTDFDLKIVDQSGKGTSSFTVYLATSFTDAVTKNTKLSFALSYAHFYSFFWHWLVYDVDDEYIPKNSSLVVRRMPTKSAATSLIARLKGNFRGGSVASKWAFSKNFSPLIKFVALHCSDLCFFLSSIFEHSLPVKTDIVMPVKAEAEPLIVSAIATAPVHIEATALASSEMLTEEENDALNQISQRCVLAVLHRTKR